VNTIPVVLFAYARPVHLGRALASLRANGVPLIHAYADGSKGPADAAPVAATRALLHGIDWAEVRIIERAGNLGLGRNVLEGVSEMAARHDAFIVWEDDLVAVPGTYAWMSAALDRYSEDERVMSVTAWTHPRVTPGDLGGQPYFDARAECWVWGTWARAWRGMADATALEMLAAAARRGAAADAVGSDLPRMARAEARKNIWAVRWLYHHLAGGGLCLRPPWSMVEHIGFDASATHAAAATEWANAPLRAAPPPPPRWPEPREHPECRRLWREANPPTMGLARLKSAAKAVVPAPFRRAARALFGWRWFEGDHATWAEALAVCGGYDDAAIVERVLAATIAVRDGRAAFERDGVLFGEPVPEPGLLAALRKAAVARGSPLRILDFGGALGTTYWRHRTELAGLAGPAWDVVEQARFVAAGSERLAGPALRFFADVDEAEALGAHDLLLASTALQYLQDPAEALESWMRRGFPWLLFNNLPLHAGAPDRIAVQRVPPDIYPASYPVWFFNRERFLGRFEGRYEIVLEFASEAVWPVGWGRYPSTGLLLRRKEAL